MKSKEVLIQVIAAVVVAVVAAVVVVHYREAVIALLSLIGLGALIWLAMNY